ncbi:hypothetical protein [Nonomuraea turkmeniaca]|uniref:hypothetical protein n=1 Tax=Nonomuraea turkmeniaca TaxID=103838 RepID=UPI001FE56FCF|nr:hypothetical protein [Nonomuraea turkmeniaca]
MSSLELIELYAELAADYPIWSIEDGLAEDDTGGWRQLTDRHGRGQEPRLAHGRVPRQPQRPGRQGQFLQHPRLREPALHPQRIPGRGVHVDRQRHLAQRVHSDEPGVRRARDGGGGARQPLHEVLGLQAGEVGDEFTHGDIDTVVRHRGDPSCGGGEIARPGRATLECGCPDYHPRRSP